MLATPAVTPTPPSEPPSRGIRLFPHAQQCLRQARLLSLLYSSFVLCFLLTALPLHTQDAPPADPEPAHLPYRIYDFLAPRTVLLTVNGVDFLADTFIEAALAQLPAADRNALIQAAQIAEELRSREIEVTDREIDAAADEFAATVNASRPDQPKLTPDQLLGVLGVERSMFRRYITRLAGLRKLLIADAQIPADTGIAAPAFQTASETYLKLLQIKYPAKAGDGAVYLQVGRQSISKSEAVQQYRSAVWSRAYRECKDEALDARNRAAFDALNNDVLSILDRILRYKVVYARWSALRRDITPEFKDQILQDIVDTLALRRGDLGSPQSMFEQFLRQRKTSREAFLQSYEFEMTCMLSQLVADRLEDPLLLAAFEKDPTAYGKGDPIVRMIFVASRDEDGRDLPHTDPTGLSFVDEAYEKNRRAASARARETLRLAEMRVDEKGFVAAANEYNQDPATREQGGRIGRIPPTAKDPRFTPAMMAEIARLAALPPLAPGRPVEGRDGWYRFQVDSIENPAFESVRRRVFLDLIDRERRLLEDRLMHDAKLEGLFAPAYRAYLDAAWKAKYETPDLPAAARHPPAPTVAPAPEAHP